MRHTIDALGTRGFANITAVYAVPTTPGRCRAFVRQPFQFKNRTLPKLLSLLPKFLGGWAWWEGRAGGRAGGGLRAGGKRYFGPDRLGAAVLVAGSLASCAVVVGSDDGMRGLGAVAMLAHAHMPCDPVHQLPMNASIPNACMLHPARRTHACR